MKPDTWTLDPLKMPEDQKAYVQMILDGFTKPDGDCLRWIGTISNRSAAISFMVHKARGRYQVRRLLWEMYVGPVPKGRVISSRCGDRLCINRDHLVAKKKGGVCAENLRRTLKVRTLALARSAQQKAKLDWEIVKAIRQSSASGPEVAIRYGISKGHVNSIRRMECWIPADVRQLRAA